LCFCVGCSGFFFRNVLLFGMPMRYIKYCCCIAYLFIYWPLLLQKISRTICINKLRDMYRSKYLILLGYLSGCIC
jgi:hypothetical protein